jgi:predicted protein tyrosine phosphatase
MTETEEIFSNSCPYQNSSQTSAKRFVFVCSGGLLRSPTAQVAASTLGYNARACGSNPSVALIPLTPNLVNWANKIVFMNAWNYDEAIEYASTPELRTEIHRKNVVWEIDDDYNWGDTALYHTILFYLNDKTGAIHR